MPQETLTLPPRDSLTAAGIKYVHPPASQWRLVPQIYQQKDLAVPTQILDQTGDNYAGPEVHVHDNEVCCLKTLFALQLRAGLGLTGSGPFRPTVRRSWLLTWGTTTKRMTQWRHPAVEDVAEHAVWKRNTIILLLLTPFAAHNI